MLAVARFEALFIVAWHRLARVNDRICEARLPLVAFATFMGQTSLRLMLLAFAVTSARAVEATSGAKEVLQRAGLEKGICVVLGLPTADGPALVVDLAARSELTVYFQTPSAAEELAVRQAAAKAGLLGNRIFADRGSWDRIQLADNLAGAIWVAPAAQAHVPRAELLRVLHPEGNAIVGQEEVVKPFPAGIDAWSQPFHGSDNNPQSTDRVARAPYLTQFLAEPMFCAMPEVTVAAGGRLFKAFGHIAHRANQNAMLNTLIAINGYNGTILWRRQLREGFCIHRNTMIATPELLSWRPRSRSAAAQPAGDRLDRAVPVARLPHVDGGIRRRPTGGRPPGVVERISGGWRLGGSRPAPL